MSFGRAQEAERSGESADMLPSPSPTPRRSDASIMADELSRLAEQINWPRVPELKEFEQMADTILSAGYYSAEELADASLAERQQLYKISSDGRAGWARLLRKILDAKAPPTEVEIKMLKWKEELSAFSRIRMGKWRRPLRKRKEDFWRFLRRNFPFFRE